MQHDETFVDRWFCRVCDTPVMPGMDALAVHICDLNDGGECGDALLHGECVVTWLDAVRAVFAKVEEELSSGQQDQ